MSQIEELLILIIVYNNMVSGQIHPGQIHPDIYPLVLFPISHNFFEWWLYVRGGVIRMGG